MSDEVILEVKGISKAFGGVKAVDNVSFTLHKGETMGVIGPNGSGKTSLVNLITGFIKKDSGQVLFKGKDISKLPPHRIADLGIGRTFQVMRPYPSLQAYKNLIVPLFSSRVRRTAHGKLGDRDAVAIDILEDIGFEREAYVPYKLASSLPLGYLKRLELGRCLALKSELIIADEVFSGLSMAEIASMIPVVEKLQMEGISIIMIEHRLGELFRVANKVLVLNFGQKVAEDIPGKIMDRPEVQQAYFGTQVEVH
jgi:branched-chain amino acid transport system ATP-binding protein